MSGMEFFGYPTHGWRAGDLIIVTCPAAGQRRMLLVGRCRIVFCLVR